MEQPDLTIEQISAKKFVLRADGIRVGTLLLQQDWTVKRGTTTALQRVFAIGEDQDVEVVREVVRRPNAHMTEAGVFDKNGQRLGTAGPPPYPNHTSPQDFVRY